MNIRNVLENIGTTDLRDQFIFVSQLEHSLVFTVVDA